MRRTLLALSLVAVAGACDSTVLTGPEAERAVERARPMVGEAGFPLLFVDGKEVEAREVREIPSTAIERVEVVKGAAAVRVYGERGSAGVILITLKAGADLKRD